MISAARSAFDFARHQIHTRMGHCRQSAVFRDIHRQIRYRAVEEKPPVPVPGWIRLKIHAIQLCLGRLTDHSVPSILLLEIRLQRYLQLGKTLFHRIARSIEAHIRFPVQWLSGLDNPAQIFHGLIIPGHGT
jgi:hypothetical protein